MLLQTLASRERVPDATPLRLEHQPDGIAYPQVRAVAPHLRVENLDAVFEFGLDVIFEALARQTGQPASSPAAAGSARRRTR